MGKSQVGFRPPLAHREGTRDRLGPQGAGQPPLRRAQSCRRTLRGGTRPVAGRDVQPQQDGRGRVRRGTRGFRGAGRHLARQQAQRGRSQGERQFFPAACEWLGGWRTAGDRCERHLHLFVPGLPLARLEQEDPGGFDCAAGFTRRRIGLFLGRPRQGHALSTEPRDQFNRFHHGHSLPQPALPGERPLRHRGHLHEQPLGRTHAGGGGPGLPGPAREGGHEQPGEGQTADEDQRAPHAGAVQHPHGGQPAQPAQLGGTGALPVGADD